MIAKERDACTSKLRLLEQSLSGIRDNDKRMSLCSAISRLRSSTTSEAACVFLDAYFGDSPEWVVMHDIRFHWRNRYVSMNHLLFNASLDFFCIDSRYMGHSLSFSGAGICHSCSATEKNLIASPIAKLQKDMRLLGQMLKDLEVLPAQFGVKRVPDVHGYVLTNPSLRNERATGNVDMSMVIPGDALFSLIWKRKSPWLKAGGRRESATTLMRIADTLADHHSPIVTNSFVEALCATQAGLSRRPSMIDTAHCAQCARPVSEHTRQHCFRNLDAFEHKVLCEHCQVEWAQKSMAGRKHADAVPSLSPSDWLSVDFADTLH